MEDLIIHTGVVERIVGNSVRVRIVQASACSACSAAGLCKSSEAKEKLIDITTSRAARLSVGQEVKIEGSTRQGLWATLWAYIMPLGIVVAALVATVRLTGSEALAAGVALALGALYFVGLYALRHRIERRLTFRIQ